MRETEKVFLWIIKIGLWLIPFLPLYVSSSMLFPFITGKNFAFRIIVEIIFALWVGLAFLREEYRPKLTPLFKAVTIFIAVVFFADLFSPNSYRSFFSNYERMEGFMMVLHLYLYFVMLFSVFTRRDWLVFFHTTLLASVLISYIAFLQKLGFRVSLQGGFRVDSTIGNPTYLAAYLVFHLWMLLILMRHYWEKWWLEIIYALIFLFELAIIYFTATRGAILALIATGVLFLAALVIFWPRAFPARLQTRKFTAGILALVIVIPILFWLVRNTEFVQSNQILRRLTNYSFQEDTIQARFRIWGMSWRGFLERPILGWGQENYYLVFQKFYDPWLWSQEPWFDRSHNIFFDWLIHAGILGLLSYLSILGVFFWTLWRGVRKNILPFWQGTVLICMFAAHFLQNIFVFDNLNTYLLFFGFLAYGGHLSIVSEDAAARRNKFFTPGRYAKAYGISAFLLVFVLIAGIWLHLYPIRESKALIQALQVYQYQGGMDQVIGFFRHALSYNTFGNTEVREQILNIGHGVPGNNRFKPEEQKKFIEFSIEELTKEISRPAKDVKHLLFLGSILNRSLGANPEYPQLAQRSLEEAFHLSPTKQLVAFELAQYYALVGNGDRSTEVLYKTWKGDPSFQEAGINLWIMAILAKKVDIINEVSRSIKFEKLGEDSLYRIGQAYQRTEQYEGALPIYAELVRISPKNPKYHATYAALLVNSGRIKEAKVEAETAGRLDPEFKKEANKFIKGLSK